MGFKNRFSGMAAAATVCLTLSACGGGGDGGSDPTARGLMTLDATTAEPAAGSVYDGLASQQGSGTTKVGAAAASRGGDSTRVSQIPLKYLARFQREQTTRGDVSAAEVFTCDGGGTIDLTETSVTFNNCRENYPDSSYDVTNGSVTVTGLQQSGDENLCTINQAPLNSIV